MRILLLGLALAACNKGRDDDTTDTTDTDAADACYALADGRCVTETFADPSVLEPVDGVYTLTFGPSEVTIDGQRHCVRSYNGQYPGPTIDVPARDGAGRQVRVDLVNAFTKPAFRSLEGGECTCTDGMGMDCSPHAACGGHGGCTCVDADGDACEHAYDFNLTNLHFHGGHVEPDAASGGGCTPDAGGRCRDCDADECDGDASDDTCFYGDDVLTQVAAGEGTKHRFDLDEDGTHHAGLYWYHPHIHGSTAVQVASGAAGAMIVRGDLDEVAGIADARERVIVLSTPPVAQNGFEPLAEGEACTEDSVTFDDFSVMSDFLAPQLNVINGQRRPRMITAPGQTELWRIVHAGFLDEVFLGVFEGDDADCSSWKVSPETVLPMRQVARDGIVLPQVYDSDYLFMSPGYRIEAALGADRFADGDTWCFVAGRFLQAGDGPPTSPPEPPTEAEIDDLLSRGDLVAILNVTAAYGEPTETALPTNEAIAAIAPSTIIDGVSAVDRCAAAEAIDDPAAIDQLAILQVGFWTADEPDPCGCDNYNVNCRNFGETDRERYPFDRDLVLGGVDHWRLGASVDGHPFHIHTNPVLLCPSDNPFDPIPVAHWRDTYLVNLARRADVIANYRKFTGAHVFHCHKLTHEDHGMMEVIRVCDPAEDASCGDNGWRDCDPDDLVCVQKLAATECAALVEDDLDAAACSVELAGPTGVCGPNACTTDGDCGFGTTCVDHVCRPG